MCKNKKLVSLRLDPELLDWIDKTSKNSIYYDRTAVISNLLQYLKDEATPGIITKMICQSYHMKEQKQVKICLKEYHEESETTTH